MGSQRWVIPYIGNSHCVLTKGHNVLVRLRHSLTAVLHQVYIVLLVHPSQLSGTIHSIVNLQGQKSDASKRELSYLHVTLLLVCLDSAGVWLSC